jgi:Tfp pilus assembly protein PilO
MTQQILKRGKEIAGSLRRRITPAFLVALFLSFIFWYSGKLSYTYTAEVPISVTIEGERHRVTCVVEGTGHNIISTRYFKRKKVKLRRTDVVMLPVEGVSDTYQVTSESLHNAIAVRNANLKIISVSALPYICLED